MHPHIYGVLTCLVVCSVALSACHNDVSLEPEHNRHLSFSSLPEEVQQVYHQYQAGGDRLDPSWDQVSTDSTVRFRHEHTGIDDGLFTLITRGFKHHFYIENRHFVLSANQGRPFVLHDGRLYYSLDLNLVSEYSTPVEQATYVEVDLRGELSDI